MSFADLTPLDILSIYENLPRIYDALTGQDRATVDRWRSTKNPDDQLLTAAFSCIVKTFTEKFHQPAQIAAFEGRQHGFLLSGQHRHARNHTFGFVGAA